MSEHNSFELIPDWVRQLSAAGLGATVVAFARDPQAFIVERVAEFSLGIVVDIGLGIIGYVNALVTAIASAFGDTGEALLSAAVAVAQVPLIVLEIWGDVLVTIASAAGPLAPVVAVLLWAVSAALLAMTIRALLRVLPLILPWL